MQIEGPEILGLVALLAGLAGNLVIVGNIAGTLKARLAALEERQKEAANRFDADLGRLNNKVDNDVQGRRAVAAMQERVARLEERADIRDARVA